MKLHLRKPSKLTWTGISIGILGIILWLIGGWALGSFLLLMGIVLLVVDVIKYHKKP